jgi:uncharacterized OB-fold protein
MADRNVTPRDKCARCGKVFTPAHSNWAPNCNRCKDGTTPLTRSARRAATTAAEAAPTPVPDGHPVTDDDAGAAPADTDD